MDCISFIFIGIFLFVGIAEWIQLSRKNNLNKKISAAFKNGDYEEYSRLLNLRDKNGFAEQSRIDNIPSNMDYIKAIFVLDAAEQGVFFPNGEEVFERLDDKPIGNSDIHDDYSEDFYDGDYENYEEDLENSDHWGLG